MVLNWCLWWNLCCFKILSTCLGWTPGSWRRWQSSASGWSAKAADWHLLQSSKIMTYFQIIAWLMPWASLSTCAQKPLFKASQLQLKPQETPKMYLVKFPPPRPWLRKEHWTAKHLRHCDGPAEIKIYVMHGWPFVTTYCSFGGGQLHVPYQYVSSCGLQSWISCL